jgi:hypothetical protein
MDNNSSSTLPNELCVIPSRSFFFLVFNGNSSFKLRILLTVGYKYLNERQQHQQQQVAWWV